MGTSKVFFGLVVTVVLGAGAAGYALRWRLSVPQVDTVHFAELPLAFSQYRGTEERFDAETYAVLHADTTTLRRYIGASGDPVWWFAAYFGSQNYGEQIHSPRNCLPGGGWNILTLDRVPVHFSDRGEVIANRLLIESGGTQQIMYYFFITRLGCVASEYKLKFDLARAALAFKPRDALFVRVSAPVREEGPEAADRQCLAVLTDGLPLLSRGLPF